MSGPVIHYDHVCDTNLAHDLASPLAAVIPAVNPLTNQPQFLIRAVGGLTKLEAAAIAIAGGLAQIAALEDVDNAQIASEAATLAALVLDACADLQSRPRNAPEPPDEAPAQAADPSKILLP